MKDLNSILDAVRSINNEMNMLVLDKASDLMDDICNHGGKRGNSTARLYGAMRGAMEAARLIQPDTPEDVRNVYYSVYTLYRKTGRQKVNSGETNPLFETIAKT